MDQEVEVALAVVVNHVQSLAVEVVVVVVALNQRVNHAVDRNQDPNHQHQIKDQSFNQHSASLNIMNIDVEMLLKTKMNKDYKNMKYIQKKG